MITKTALAQRIKDTTTAFARARNGKPATDQPYLKVALADLVWPMLEAAWKEGHAEATDGIGAEHCPYSG